jgi:hypothetical protein
MPHIQLLGPIPENLCEKIASCFSPGVIGIVKDPKTVKSTVKVVIAESKDVHADWT